MKIVCEEHDKYGSRRPAALAVFEFLILLIWRFWE